MWNRYEPRKPRAKAPLLTDDPEYARQTAASQAPAQLNAAQHNAAQHNAAPQTAAPQKADIVLQAEKKRAENKNRWLGETIKFDFSGIPSRFPVCGTRRIGISHIGKGLNCQDYYSLFSGKEGEYSVIAIADGHGDSKHDLSEFGSRIACETLCRIAEEKLESGEPRNDIANYLTSAPFKYEIVKQWKTGAPGKDGKGGVIAHFIEYSAAQDRNAADKTKGADGRRGESSDTSAGAAKGTGAADKTAGATNGAATIVGGAAGAIAGATGAGAIAGEVTDDAYALIDHERVYERYGTTLLFAIAWSGLFIVGQLGDGGVVLLGRNPEDDRVHKVLLERKIGSGVHSICSTNADAYINIKTYSEADFYGLVLMTDGFYDPWPDDPHLFGAARFFADTLRDNSSKAGAETKLLSAYNDNYNKFADYASDDITIGVMVSSADLPRRKSAGGYEIVKLLSSGDRSKFALTKDGTNFRGVYRRFSDGSYDNKRSAAPLNDSVAAPLDSFTDNCGGAWLIFPEPTEKRMTLGGYCERAMTARKLEMDVLLALNVTENILRIFSDSPELARYGWSLGELSEAIEFSPESGKAVIYITAPPISNQNASPASASALLGKYLLHFLGLGRFFYNDSFDHFSFILTNSEYKNIVNAYYGGFFRNLVVAARSRENKDGGAAAFKALLDDTRALKAYGVRCMKCKKSSIVNKDRKGKCPSCETEFELFAYLRSSADGEKLPLSANTVVRTYNIEEDAYVDTFEVIKSNNRIGLKNVSDRPQSASLAGGDGIAVDVGQVKDLSNCSSITAYGVVYEIVRQP